MRSSASGLTLCLTIFILRVQATSTQDVSSTTEPAATPSEGTTQLYETTTGPLHGTTEEVRGLTEEPVEGTTEEVRRSTEGPLEGTTEGVTEWTGGQREDEGVYSVTTEDGRVCVRAQLEVSFSVRYFTAGLITTRLLTKEFNLPDDAEVRGDCNDTSARLNFVWDQGNSSLTFYFYHNATGEPPSWSITRVTFIFMTGSGTQYPEIIQGGEHVVESYAGAVLLTAPDNTSFTCDVEQDIELYETVPPDMDSALNTSAIESVTLGLFNAKVQAGPVPPEGFSETELRCDADLLIHDERVRVVTVTIACCLAALIFIIIIVYGIYRTRSAPTPYASME